MERIVDGIAARRNALKLLITAENRCLGRPEWTNILSDYTVPRVDLLRYLESAPRIPDDGRVVAAVLVAGPPPDPNIVREQCIATYKAELITLRASLLQMIDTAPVERRSPAFLAWWRARHAPA